MADAENAGAATATVASAATATVASPATATTIGLVDDSHGFGSGLCPAEQVRTA